MIRYGRLLVPVDGSDASHTAARHAMALATATGAAVDVLHVVERGRAGTAGGGPDHRAAVEERGRLVLGQVERMAEAAGVEATTDLRTGSPHRTILDHAEESGTHLVVMGRRGAGTVGERLMGGVTERVLRASPIPVLTTRAESATDGIVDAADVLLPTDGSDPAERAGEHAASVAALAGARVHVVSVVEAGAASSERARNATERAHAATDRLAGSVESAAGVPCERAVVSGRAAESLAEYVEDADVDAVVMGASGRGGVERLLLGSVTERLLRTVDVPVLVVPAGD